MGKYLIDKCSTAAGSHSVKRIGKMSLNICRIASGLRLLKSSTWSVEGFIAFVNRNFCTVEIFLHVFYIDLSRKIMSFSFTFYVSFTILKYVHIGCAWKLVLNLCLLTSRLGNRGYELREVDYQLPEVHILYG